jgi:hypothetical protein
MHDLPWANIGYVTIELDFLKDIQVTASFVWFTLWLCQNSYW